MADIFLKIVNMSISACWIVLAILLLRLVFKKAPKWINCVLWGIAGLRLIMPFSFESIFSLIPSAETITKVSDSPRPQINSGVSVIDNQVNGYLQGNYFEGVTRPVGNFVDITTILAIVWIIGIVALLIYTLVSYLRLKNKIGTAVLLRDNIYQSEAVVSPFVLGIFKPKIFLPFDMNEQDTEYVIAHEQAHISRKDYLWKPLGFLILTLHWFNPMVWLGYILLCRDIELACDEKVIKELNTEQRADYSQALLTCSVNRRMIAACPLAFGEVGVKDRIKSVLNYKKPAFWIILIAIVASAVVAVCFLTNPAKDAEIFTITDGYTTHDQVDISATELMVGDKTGHIIVKWNNQTNKTLSYGEEFHVYRKVLGTKIECRNSNDGWDDLLYEMDGTDGERTISLNGIKIKSKGEYVLEFDFNVSGDDKDYTAYIEFVGKDESNDIQSVENQERITWSYRPILSFTGHYAKAFFFDFDYTHVEATCTDGEMWNLEAEGQPRDTTMRFEKGKNVYWTPSDEIEKIPQKSELTLKVYNNKTQLHKCTVIFECVYRDLSGAEFEIYLKDSDGLEMMYYDGRITFVKQSSISNIGGADGPSNVIVSTTIDELKVKYPQFFNVSTDGGLTVYIWQMSASNYSCYLVNTSMEAISDNSFAYDVGATIPEMRAILTTYNVDQKDITVQPVINPLSSYYYVIDDAYRSKIKELFWEDYSIFEADSEYSPIIDTATFDIDGDGEDEHCVLTCGPTSGLSTIVFTATEVGRDEAEYINTFNMPYTYGTEFYKSSDGKLKIKCANSIYENGVNVKTEDIFLDIEIENGNISLKNGNEDIGYWGEQGITPSEFSNKLNALENAVSEAILKENKGKYVIDENTPENFSNAKSFEAHEIMHIIKDDEKQTLTVYAFTLYEEFNLEADSVVSHAAGADPVEIVFDIKGDMEYKLIKYRTLEKNDDIKDYLPEDYYEYDEAEIMENLRQSVLSEANSHYGYF